MDAFDAYWKASELGQSAETIYCPLKNNRESEGPSELPWFFGCLLFNLLRIYPKVHEIYTEGPRIASPEYLTLERETDPT